MAYNRENNIDDLIALTAAATTSAQDDQTDQTYYLVLEEFDGRGAFSNPPYAYGLSQVVHIFREDELTTKTVADLLKQYPDGEQFFESQDENNLVTHNGVQVTPKDTLKSVFGGDTKATLYLRNRTCKSYRVLEGEDEQPEKRRSFLCSTKCLLIFGALWILKFILVCLVIWILKYYGVL